MLDERNRRMKNDDSEGANYAAKARSHLPQLLHVHKVFLDALYNYLGDI